MDTEVLVVGAGPTGLLLACELRRRDIDVTLIDALDAPRGWDRASELHARSLQVFESLGIVDRFLDAGVPVRGARFYGEGEELGTVDLSAINTRYDFNLGLSEEVTEQILTETLQAWGGSVTRATALSGLRSDGEGVVATVGSGCGQHEIGAQWIVGCDGFHSTTRDLLGVTFSGEDIEMPWAVFDAGIDGWDGPTDLDVTFRDEAPLLLTVLPGSRWRLYVRPSSPRSDVVSEASEVISRYVPSARLVDVDEPSRFHPQSRVADHYRAERVFLAGDAAHACTPAQGHGMNTGLQDAHNLGWKLALVCRGAAGSGLLGSYEAERRPIGVRVVQSGAEAEVAWTQTDEADRIASNQQLRTHLQDADASRRASLESTELDHAYHRSPIVIGPIVSGPDSPRMRQGELLLDTGPVVTTDRVEAGALHELALRPGHTVLVLGAPATPPERLSSVLAEAVRRRRDEGIVDASFAVGLGPDDARELGVDDVTLLAVRPDRHIGLRNDGGDVATLDAYIDLVRGRSM